MRSAIVVLRRWPISHSVFLIPLWRGLKASISSGNIGGIGLGTIFANLGLPCRVLSVLVAWFVGDWRRAGGWFIGKITLGLRSDYFAIALGIAEIVVSFAKNEQG